MKFNKIIIALSGILLMATLTACSNSTESQKQMSSEASKVTTETMSNEKNTIKAKAVSENSELSKDSTLSTGKKEMKLASSANQLTEAQQAALTGWYAGKYANTDGQPAINAKIGVTKASTTMKDAQLPTGGNNYYQMYWQDGYGDKSLTYAIKDNQVYIYDNNGKWQHTTMQSILDKAKNQGVTGQISTVAGNTQLTDETK